MKKKLSNIDNMRAQVVSLSKNKVTIEGLKKFEKGFATYHKQVGLDEGEVKKFSGLKSFYTDQFGAKYEEENPGRDFSRLDDTFVRLTDN